VNSAGAGHHQFQSRFLGGRERDRQQERADGGAREALLVTFGWVIDRGR